MTVLYGTGLAFVELAPVHGVDNRKSYYGKAVMRFDSVTGNIMLFSYSTPVCQWNPRTSMFTRLWGGYSWTTMRHINSFMAHNGLSYNGKKWWDALPMDKAVKL